ncbi:hypothetical protein RHECNPAF_1360045 [Rhizobium etli CNPAF512]|nr:hypothetical protein RHECNPAF_1360045 [Rhizobium etli CNPAF512]
MASCARSLSGLARRVGGVLAGVAGRLRTRRLADECPRRQICLDIRRQPRLGRAGACSRPAAAFFRQSR